MSTAEIQRTIIRFAPVLENAELQSLTRQLTDSLGSRAAPSPRSATTTTATAAIIGRYRVIHKAVARAGFELTSAAVDVLQPGQIIEVVERRSVIAADDPQGLGIVRVRCTDGTWLSVSNRSGEPLITEVHGSPTLASPRSRDSSAKDQPTPPTPSEDGDTLFEHHADAQLGDAIRQHVWMGGQSPAGDAGGQQAETPRSQLRLVKSEREQLQPTLSRLSIRDFEEMEELAERETVVQSGDYQLREDGQQNAQQFRPPNSPALPTPVPVPSPAVSAAHSAGGSELGEAVARSRTGEANKMLVDASLALCEVVLSNCRLSSDTAKDVETLVQEQRKRWGGAYCVAVACRGDRWQRDGRS